MKCLSEKALNVGEESHTGGPELDIEKEAGTFVAEKYLDSSIIGPAVGDASESNASGCSILRIETKRVNFKKTVKSREMAEANEKNVE